MALRRRRICLLNDDVGTALVTTAVDTEIWINADDVDNDNDAEDEDDDYHIFQ